MDVLQRNSYVKSDGTEVPVYARIGWGCTLTTRNGRTWIKNAKGILFEFTPEAHDKQVGYRNIVEKVADHSFKVYMSVKVIQALEAYWAEVLKPARRLQTDVFSDIEATQDSVKVRQFDGKVFEWTL